MTRKPNLDKSVFITVVVFFRDIFSKENCLTRSKKPEGIVLNKWRGTGSLFLDKVRRSGDEATRLSSVRGVFLGGWRLEELRKVSERWAMCWHWQGQFSPRQSDSSDGGKNGRRLDYYSRVWFRVKSWKGLDVENSSSPWSSPYLAVGFSSPLKGLGVFTIESIQQAIYCLIEQFQYQFLGIKADTFYLFFWNVTFQIEEVLNYYNHFWKT